MNLESQVCSLELAKRLKELGVPQESLWYWVQRKNTTAYVTERDLAFGYQPKNMGKVLNTYSAFTVAELGELALKDSNVEWKLFHNPRNGIWMLYSAGTPGYHDPDLPVFTADTLVNTLAKMLIYLKENLKK